MANGAIDIINSLAAAQASGSIKQALNHYIKPRVLCIDELGYLPIDKFGADCPCRANGWSEGGAGRTTTGNHPATALANTLLFPGARRPWAAAA